MEKSKMNNSDSLAIEKFVSLVKDRNKVQKLLTQVENETATEQRRCFVQGIEFVERNLDAVMAEWEAK
jgi:hypothetical protein